MDYFPNVDAVQFFCREIWPKIRAQVPAARFNIVGQRPESAVKEWDGKDGITVTGRVEDIRPYIGRAPVYVVPLRVGGGVRLKILEALAMGKAVVSTPVGAEGIEIEAGKQILLAKDAGAFANQVISLLRSSEQRRVLEKAARTFAENHAGWNAVTSRLEDIYFETIAARREQK
jgi:glycosyltransferase involved in cell wall biosynthesis